MVPFGQQMAGGACAAAEHETVEPTGWALLGPDDGGGGTAIAGKVIVDIVWPSPALKQTFQHYGLPHA